MLIVNLHPDTPSTESEKFQSGPCLHPGPCNPNSLFLSKLFHDSPKVPGLVTFLKIIQLAGSMQWYLEDSFIYVYRQAEILGCSCSMLRSASIQQSTFPGQTFCHKLSNSIQMPKFRINLCNLAGRHVPL